LLSKPSQLFGIIQRINASSYHHLACLAVALILQTGSSTAKADELLDLLNQTDAALSGNKKDAPQETKATLPKSKSATKNSQTKSNTPTSSAHPSPAKKKADAKPVLTPADAESVNELISVGLRREARLDPEKRRQIFGLALGIAQLRGNHQVTKDDDTFRVHQGERVNASYLSYVTELSNALFTFGGIGKVTPIGSFGAGFMSGSVLVDRTGIENELIEVDYNIISTNIGLGLQTTLFRHWHIGTLLGPGAEMLVQTGEGTSDSTSDFFFSDAFGLTLERSFDAGFSAGILWQSRGNLPSTRDQTGHNLWAITINTLLAG
jgi:hypothetical protein